MFKVNSFCPKCCIENFISGSPDRHGFLRRPGVRRLVLARAYAPHRATRRAPVNRIARFSSFPSTPQPARAASCLGIATALLFATFAERVMTTWLLPRRTGLPATMKSLAQRRSLTL